MLGAGTAHLAVQPGPFAVDELRLSSPAVGSPLRARGGGGRVLDVGTSGHGSYDHVKVAVGGPSWLVLGEGYNRGWHAWCDGRQLGAPVPIDGYANGWRVGPICHRVRFAFGPNRLAAIGYAVSALAAAVCLLLLIAGGLAARRRGDRRLGEQTAQPTSTLPVAGPESASLAGREAPAPLTAPGALVAALVAGAAFGFVFGLTAGAISVPAIALVLWRGIGARELTVGAGVLLGVVVPLLYLAHPGDSRGGNHFTYAMAHLAAHWVGVAALGLLMGAWWRAVSRSGRARTATATQPPAAERGA
jgi:hypothetical protein